MEGLMSNLWWLLVWVVLGLLAGAIAKFIMPGKDGGGYLATIVLGIAGALLGGFIASFLNIGAADGFGFVMTLIFAVIGALVLLFIYRLATGRSISG